MAPLLTEVADIQLQLTTHLSTRRNERLSWPGWLTYSGPFTHINGHPSATGRAQDRESLMARPTCYRCATQPVIKSFLVRIRGYLCVRECAIQIYIYMDDITSGSLQNSHRLTLYVKLLHSNSVY